MLLYTVSLLTAFFALAVLPYSAGEFTMMTTSNCSALVRRCLEEGMLPYIQNEKCYSPLSRGPCFGDEYWFILPTQGRTSYSRNITGVCEKRPCSPLQYRHRGRCYTQRKASYTMCAGKAVHMDVKGHLRCGDDPGWKALLNNELSCVIIQYPLIAHGQNVNHQSSVRGSYNNQHEYVPSLSHSRHGLGPLPLEADD